MKPFICKPIIFSFLLFSESVISNGLFSEKISICKSEYGNNVDIVKCEFKQIKESEEFKKVPYFISRYLLTYYREKIKLEEQKSLNEVSWAEAEDKFTAFQISLNEKVLNMSKSFTDLIDRCAWLNQDRIALANCVINFTKRAKWYVAEKSQYIYNHTLRELKILVKELEDSAITEVAADAYFNCVILRQDLMVKKDKELRKIGSSNVEAKVAADRNTDFKYKLCIAALDIES